jgi:hypothetical protein
MPEPLPVDDVPSVKPEIVVSSQILPDGSVIILLTKTIGAIEASEKTDPNVLFEQLAISDALVTISGDRRIDTLALVQPGVYGGATIAFQIGAEYHLKVMSKKFGEVSATTRVQSFIMFDSVNANLHYNGYNDFYAQVMYGVIDPPVTNYYMVNVAPFKEKDVLKDVVNPEAYTRLVEDGEFNGREFSEILTVDTRDFAEGDSLTVSLANVTSEYYNFMKLRIDNRLSFIEFLSEPINYPTNIKGGKGFFNLYIPDIRLVVL